MASRNHVYYELQDSVYKRYIKTTIGILSGMRVNPHDLKQRIPFLLQSDENRIEYEKDEYGFDKSDKVRTIHPPSNDEILETYSVEEDKIFRRINSALFDQGYLIETAIGSDVETTDNALTDNQIEDMCNNWLRFKKQLVEITAPITLDRIEQQLKKLDRNKRWFDLLNEHRITLG